MMIASASQLIRAIRPIIATLCLFSVVSAFADSGTWKMNSTGDWNTDSNWTGHNLPNGPADIASFASSNTTNVSISGNVETNAILFTDRARSYSITASPGIRLTLGGTGIV